MEWPFLFAIRLLVAVKGPLAWIEAEARDWLEAIDWQCDRRCDTSLSDKGGAAKAPLCSEPMVRTRS